MKLKKPYLIISLVFLTLLLLSNYVLYVLLQSDYDKKIGWVWKDLQQTEKQLNANLAEQKDDLDFQVGVLRNDTNENLQNLKGYLEGENTKIKLNLESQASSLQKVQAKTADISQEVGGLQKKSSELESKISEINVNSADFSSIVEDVIKAVVSVQTNLGQGSGFFFNSRGYIMTNKHVIEGASAISVIDHNSNSYAVRIVGVAKNADLAVLKIDDASAFSSLDFAAAEDINVGNRVIAVGNPLGLSFTVTEGIISATNRQIDSTGIGYIQTDVSINPGNSGGPLINAAKKVVGINTLKITDTEGIGFAIPSSTGKTIAEQAVKQDSG